MQSMKTVAFLFLLPVLQTECRRLKPTYSESALNSADTTQKTLSTEAQEVLSSDFYAQDLVVNRSSASICDSLHPDGACSCVDKPGLAALECSINLLNFFTPTVALEVNPCAKPATVKAVFRESTTGTEKEIATDAENPVHAPIPGITLPLYVANVSVIMDVVLEEKAGKLDLDIGLNGCGEVMWVGKLCGSQIPGISSVLPYSLLKETIDTSNCR